MLLLVFAVVGLVASVLARRQIRQSDGTMAGEIPATIGIVLSVACGLGWATHRFTMQTILAHEASAAIESWLTNLREGDEAAAFLAAELPRERRSVPSTDVRTLRAHFPPDPGSTVGRFDVFRSADLPSVLFRYGSQFVAHTSGLKGWRYERGSYFVKYDYTFTTPEVTRLAEITAISEDVSTPQGQRREWRILHINRNEATQLTQYGQELKDAQRDSTRVVIGWIQTVSAGKLKEAADFFTDEGSRDVTRQVYDFLRGDAPPDQAVMFMLRLPFLLVHDEKVGAGGWKLVYRTVLDATTREAEIELTAHTDDAGKGEMGWKLQELKFLGGRKKPKPAPLQQPSAPTITPRRDS
jgi:hypothetical protein